MIKILFVITPLHIQTPTSWEVMSERGDTDCAF